VIQERFKKEDSSKWPVFILLKPYVRGLDYPVLESLRKNYAGFIGAQEEKEGHPLQSCCDMTSVRTSLKILAASIKTAQSQYTKEERKLAEQDLSDLGNILSKDMDLSTSLSQIKQKLPQFKELQESLLTNPYLKSRALMGLEIIESLEAL